MDLMKMTIGDFFLESVRANSFAFILGNKGIDLAGAVHSLIGFVLLVTIIIKGIMIIGNSSTTTPKSLVKMALWAVFATSLSTPSIYVNVFIIPVLEVRDNLAMYMISTDDFHTSGGVFEAISGSFSYMLNYSWQLIKKGGISNLAPFFAGIVIGLVYGLYYVTIVVNLVLCEIILSFLFVMGIIVVPLSTFETLRGVLKSWLTLIAQYSLVVVCSSMFISILNSINVHAIENLAKIKGIDGMLSPWMGLVLVVACFGMLVMKVTFDISGHLSGGMLGAGQDGMSSVKSSMGNAATTLRMGNTARKGGLAAARAAKAKLMK